MRERILFAALVAGLAFATAPAARAEGNAQWVAVWNVTEDETGHRLVLVLKDAAGKIAGDLESGSHDSQIVFSRVTGDTLRIRFEDRHSTTDRGDADVTMEHGGMRFRGWYVHRAPHWPDQKGHWTGVRQ